MEDYFRLALIGHPISHSLSPTLHNAALQFVGLKGEYKLIDIEPNKINDSLLKSLPKDLEGFNVTIPYKEKFFQLLKKKTVEAQLIGAINTVRIEANKSLSGHNTDLLGFVEALSDSYQFSSAKKNALIIGAGGSARAVIVGLAQMGFTNINIKGRNPTKVQTFIDDLKTNLLHSGLKNSLPNLRVHNESEIKQSQPFSLIVNASPIGLSNEPIPNWLDALLNQTAKDTICFDLVYRKNKEKPTFTQNALDKGLPALDGLSMLIHQAKAAFHYWTGIDVPVKVFVESLDLQTKQK